MKILSTPKIHFSTRQYPKSYSVGNCPTVCELFAKSLIVNELVCAKTVKNARIYLNNELTMVLHKKLSTYSQP